MLIGFSAIRESLPAPIINQYMHKWAIVIFKTPTSIFYLRDPPETYVLRLTIGAI